jgi:putative Mn2+ efflux pump MntP
MNLFELFLIAVGLSMDAFAVALCTGLTMKTFRLRKALTVGLYFGVFQAAMPLVGYLLGSTFADKIMDYDHWVAFALLGFIGGKMIWESFSPPDCNPEEEASLTCRAMLPLAVATSIDALAVGISFAFFEVEIVPSVLLIGVVTLALSMVGVKLGNVFGSRFRAKAELAGGVILILLGVRILLEHLLA